jgi:hypothetical protein
MAVAGEAAAGGAAAGVGVEIGQEDGTMNMTMMCHLKRGLAAALLTGGLLAVQSASGLAQEQQPAEAATTDAAAADDSIFALESAEEPPLFDNPDAAVDAFRKVLADDDFDGLARLLGLDAAKLKQAEGITDTFAQIRDGAARKITIVDIDSGKILQIGDKLWPFPFPLLKGDEDGKWAFDTQAGLEEVVNRRVGENELQTIETLRAYVEAQKDYAAIDRDGDGVQEYAQKLVSSAGQTDGLYWPADEIDGESPAGDLDTAELDDAAQGEGYFGYKYKILTGQGDNIAGGAYDYVINDNMIAGFGLLAWPARYAETGVNSFAVNQHGIVYEIDLGPETGTIVKYVDRFNPDEGWTIVRD